MNFLKKLNIKILSKVIKIKYFIKYINLNKKIVLLLFSSEELFDGGYEFPCVGSSTFSVLLRFFYKFLPKLLKKLSD